MRRTVPHHTGKVAIGLLYQPPRRHTMSRDALVLQSALLEPRTGERPPILHRLIGTLWKWC